MSEPVLELDGLTRYFREDDSLVTRYVPGFESRRVRAVDDVDLTVHEGETVGLVGESGCGKSTLARAALQLLEPTGGSARFRGEELTEYDRSEERAFRQHAQVVFQDPYASLNDRYTVHKTLAEPMKEHGYPEPESDLEVEPVVSVDGSLPTRQIDHSVRVEAMEVVRWSDDPMSTDVSIAVEADGTVERPDDIDVTVTIETEDAVEFREDDVRVLKELDDDALTVTVVFDVERSNRGLRRQRAGELLRRVGLSEDHLDRHPHEFSGGQRQRVAIARALSVEPELIVADEPTSALDVSVQAQIINLLESLQEEMGLSMLFISHDLSVVRRICDRVAVMYLGEIVEVADTDALFEDPQHPYTQALLSSIPIPDPTRSREQIPLEGDVPTPIDPPEGCRFHPRCPKIIPPEDWTGPQEGFRRIFRLKSQLENEAIDPESVRETLANDGEPSDDDAVAEELYAQFVQRRDEVDADDVDLPADAQETVRDALDALVAGDRDGAIDALDSGFESVCAARKPALDGTAVADESQTHRAACHLHDSTSDGSVADAVGSSQGVTSPDSA